MMLRINSNTIPSTFELIYDFQNVFGQIFYNNLAISFINEYQIVNFKFSANITNQLRSNLDLSKGVTFFAISSFREIDTIVHIKNCCVSSTAEILAEGYFIAFRDNEKLGDQKIVKNITKKCDKILCFNNNCQTIYGHFIYDFLASLVIVPKDLLNGAKILTAYNEEKSKEFLTLFGFNSSDLIFEENGYVFCNDLYYVKNFVPFLGKLTYSVPLLSKVLKEKLKLNEIKPTKINFLNRINYPRVLTNIHEIIKLGMRKYPKYQWKEIDCLEKNLSVFAKEISTSLVLVTSAGSGTANFIFMHEKTGVIVAAPNVIEWSVISTISLNLFMIYYKQSSLGFWEAQEIQLSQNPFFIHFKNILYAVQHGKWNSLSTDYQQFLNLNDVESRLEFKLRELELKMADIYTE